MIQAEKSRIIREADQLKLRELQEEKRKIKETDEYKQYEQLKEKFKNI